MNTLHPPPGSPWWLHAGAAAILFVHIAGGSLALVAGAAALGLRKGSRRHALAGTIFLGSMLAMAAVGALVSPLLVTRGDPHWFDSLAGFFTLYLVATGWATVRREAGTVGRFEIAASLYAGLAAAAAAGLAAQAAGRPSGTLAGYGPEGYGMVAALFALAAALDLKVVLSGGIAGTPRLARHSWRMCTALFIAAGSFFFGQQQVMPEAVQGSPWLAVPPFAVLGLMVYWLVKLRLPRRIDRFAKASAA
jgi:uncharacterized membrane protein